MSKNESQELCLITGGASGIGEACARELFRRGYEIAIADKNPKGKKIARELSGKFFPLDVSESTEIDALAESISDSGNFIHTLINCAGIIQQPLPPAELSLKTWDDIVRIDQRGTYYCSVAFAREMIKRGRGNIVNIASITAMRSVPLHAYAPAKAAVVSMTECLAAEWGRHGVRVNAVSPGHTLTPALQSAISAGERDIKLLEENALGRMVNPEEVAKAVAFLVGDESSAITGVNLPVDCGWLVAGSWHTYGGLR
jgi:NAD(P)-dependent dehydrogenase (short-subunit alcohol dehydrogenase family)